MQTFRRFHDIGIQTVAEPKTTTRPLGDPGLFFTGTAQPALSPLSEIVHPTGVPTQQRGSSPAWGIHLCVTTPQLQAQGSRARCTWILLALRQQQAWVTLDFHCGRSGASHACVRRLELYTLLWVNFQFQSLVTSLFRC